MDRPRLARRLTAVNVALCLAIAACTAPLAAQEAAYDSKVTVAAETRLDWVYPLVGSSPAAPPEKLVEGYNAKSQSYELYGPTDAPAGARLPLVLFVSPSDRPVGWPFWESTCQEHGVLFAGLRDMGNGRPAAHRVRAVLDVLDDVRDRFLIDPDRTYLAGFSGGAFVAATVARALPEYFGGVVCVGYSPEPPRKPWQLAKVRDRLSVIIINGDGDPATPIVEDLHGPWWEQSDARVEIVTLRGRGHTMPPADVFESAFRWLEDGVGARRAAANSRPALRVADAPPGEEWSARSLADAKAQLATPSAESMADGLNQLTGIAQRWDDLPAAKQAKKILADYAARTERPWEAVRTARERAIVQVNAEGFDALAHDGRATAGGRRAEFAKSAIELWGQLRATSPEAELAALANERIAALTELAAKAPAKADAASPDRLKRFRFSVEGDVTLEQAIDYTATALLQVGVRLEVDKESLRAAGIDLQKVHHPRLKAATLDDLNRRLFRRAGLTLQRSDGEVRLAPSKLP